MNIKEWGKIILTLEYLGIQIEDIHEVEDKYGFLTQTIYKFSVPEKSEIKSDTVASYGEDINTSEGLMKIAKETMIDILCDEFKDDVELLKDFKSNTSDYIKVFAKVRNGEVWNEELAKKRLGKITEYKEI